MWDYDCHMAAALLQILNGASVISSPFHRGRADLLEGRTLPQVVIAESFDHSASRVIPRLSTLDIKSPDLA
jgi:hypothetical protein